MKNSSSLVVEGPAAALACVPPDVSPVSAVSDDINPAATWAEQAVGPPDRPEQILCVGIISLSIPSTLLGLRVVLSLPCIKALNRLTQGMRMVDCHIEGEWEPSAGRVQFIVKEVRK